MPMNLKKERKQAIKLRFMYQVEGVDRKEENEGSSTLWDYFCQYKSISTFFIIILSFILLIDKMVNCMQIIVFDHFLFNFRIYFYLSELCNIFFSYFFTFSICMFLLISIYSCLFDDLASIPILAAQL